MKRNSILILPLLALLIAASCESGTKTEAPAGDGDGTTASNTTNVLPKTGADSLNYCLGVIMATGVIKDEPDSLNPEMVAAGFRAVMNSNAPMDMNTANNYVRTYMMNKAKDRLMAENAGRVEQEKQWLAENAARPEVTTTASGLQYEVMTMGSGDKPTAASTVKVHYHGTLIDGTVFDSSVDRGEPISFPLNRVIKGWTEGLQLMPVGSKFRFYIPEDIGYGPSAQGKIPALSALIFDVELLGIE